MKLVVLGALVLVWVIILWNIGTGWSDNRE